MCTVPGASNSCRFYACGITIVNKEPRAASLPGLFLTLPEVRRYLWNKESSMAEIIHRGKTIQTRGRLPSIGSRAPDFRLTRPDLTDVSLVSFGTKRKILNIVPSLDTGICAASTRRFDAEAADLTNVAVLTISNDLPFAQRRFCEKEGIHNVVTLSQMRGREFGAAYGVEIVDGPLAGLLSRAVVVLDEHNKVLYTEQVPEIEREPTYERALAAALK